MRFRFTRLVPWMLAVAGGILPAADNPPVVFRSDVSLVRVDAQVVDRDNRAITGLAAADFILRDEGKPQPIRNFGSENMPMDVLLLLDVSASMRPHVERIADASQQALRVLQPEDRIAIMVFDRSTRVRMPFRGSRDDVQREFQRLLKQESFNGGTDITRGMLDAARYIAREGRRDARRAIVILTDDQTERDRNEAKVQRALSEANAVMCSLIAPDAMRNRGYGGGYPRGGGGGGYPGGGWPGGGGIGGPLGGIILGRRGPYGGRGGNGPVMVGPHTQSAGTAGISRQSGGDSMPVDDAYALENTLARLRQRYALHFYLPQGAQPGQERNVEVELADAALRRYPGAEVRYRHVYITPGGTEGATPASTPAPTVVTQAPVESDGSATAASSRRRPAVDGPVGGAGPSISSPADQGGWRHTGDAAPQPAQNSGSSDPPSQGGWRKLKPGEQP